MAEIEQEPQPGTMVWLLSSVVAVRPDARRGESRGRVTHGPGELESIREMGSSVNAQAAVNALRNVNI